MTLEFAIVFAGIFLGLAADDWRDGRVNRGREHAALAGILEDLRADSAQLAAVRRTGRNWDRAGLWILRNAGAAVSPDSAVAVTTPLVYVTVYRPQRAVYTGLREAGDLGLISDGQLRSEVVRYFDERQQYIERLYTVDNYGPYWEAQREWRKYYRRTARVDGESLFDKPGLELLVPWKQASADQAFVSALVELGVFGAVAATRVEGVLESNRALRAAIEPLVR